MFGIGQNKDTASEYNQRSAKSAAYGNMVIYLVPIFASFILYNYLAAIQFNPFATLSFFATSLVMGAEGSKTVIRRVESKVQYKDVFNCYYFETAGHVYQEHIIVGEGGVRPVALLDNEYKVVSDFSITPAVLEAAETAPIEFSVPKSGAKFIEYEITPTEESELFDRLLIATPVSWHRLIVTMKDEFPYRFVLIEGRSVPIFLVKMFEWIHENERTVLCEVGFSAYHAELIQSKSKIMSISDAGFVDVEFPIAVTNSKGEIVYDNTGQMQYVKIKRPIPITQIMLGAYDNLKSVEKGQIIASREAEIREHEKTKRDFAKSSAAYKDTMDDLDRRMRKKGPRKQGISFQLPKSRGLRIGFGVSVAALALLWLATLIFHIRWV